MAFGDFGAPMLVSAPSAGEVYVRHPHGGIVGSGFRPALSRGSAG